MSLHHFVPDILVSVASEDFSERRHLIPEGARSNRTAIELALSSCPENWQVSQCRAVIPLYDIEVIKPRGVHGRRYLVEALTRVRFNLNDGLLDAARAVERDAAFAHVGASDRIESLVPASQIETLTVRNR